MARIVSLLAALSVWFPILAVPVGAQDARQILVAPAGTQAAKQDASQLPLVYSAWAKLCTPNAATGKQACLTGQEGRLDTGALVAGATLVETAGAPKVLRITLPFGMQLKLGTRIIIDSGQPITGPYLGCTSRGCTADYDASPDTIAQLRKAQTLTIQAINAVGKPISVALPMADFAKAYDGAPTDAKLFAEEAKKPPGPGVRYSLPQLLTQAQPQPAFQLTAEQLNALVNSPWTKFCLQGQEAGAKLVCFTGTDARLASGTPVGALVLIEPQGDAKKLLRATLPLGLRLPAGVRIVVDQGQPAELPYVICFANGCMADLEASADVIAGMTAGRQVILKGISSDGQAISVPLALTEFAKAHDGPATDPKVFEAQQKKLQEELQRRAQDAGGKIADQPSPAKSTVAAALPSASVAAGLGRRVALVIGNSAYQRVDRLANPRRDAESVAASLRQVGFQTVRLELDLTRDRLTDTLRAFSHEAESADWALVYYAGHGLEMSGVNYLIPVDAKLEVDRDAEFEAVPLDRVMSAVDGARKLRVVILDACRDNPFLQTMTRSLGSTRSIGRGLAPVEPDSGTLVVYSAKHGQLALDGDGVNSPFATAFVKNITAPGVDVRKMFDLVRDDVMDATNRHQQPFTYGSVSGREDFFFVTAK